MSSVYMLAESKQMMCCSLPLLLLQIGVSSFPEAFPRERLQTSLAKARLRHERRQEE